MVLQGSRILADELMMPQKILSRFALPLPQAEPAGRRSIAQRFAVPHSFAPDLSLPEAMIRVAAALARILLGSLLFALWGVFSARAWAALPGHFWQAAAILPLALLFLMPFTALMAGISSLVRAVSPKK
jgi:hypothetical protein